jgi:hypothetical protein
MKTLWTRTTERFWRAVDRLYDLWIWGARK